MPAKQSEEIVCEKEEEDLQDALHELMLPGAAASQLQERLVVCISDRPLRKLRQNAKVVWCLLTNCIACCTTY